ncbi:MAG: serine O-acetyltransferase [Rhodobacteraceae bacterium]|nr:serine O-acetyltransferase [Paracoccaceae bacterium]
MQQVKASLTSIDPVWTTIRREAEEIARDEPLMASLVHAGVLHHRSLERAMSFRIAQKLASPEMSDLILREILDGAYQDDESLGVAARADILAVYDRDPACHAYIHPLLFFKGFQALQCFRIAHWLWQEGRQDMARFIQMRTSECFGVDIHPNARIGRGVMIDHAHSIVIGETAVVGDNVSMLHSVTLGGTGKEDGDRHPKIGNGVMIGAGAAVLGNIEVGHCSRIAAGSVVLEPVPPMTTVAGVPAKVVGKVSCAEPARMMDQTLGEGPDLKAPLGKPICGSSGCGGSQG